MKTTIGAEKSQKSECEWEEGEGETGWSPLQNKVVGANVDVF